MNDYTHTHTPKNPILYKTGAEWGKCCKAGKQALSLKWSWPSNTSSLKAVHSLFTNMRVLVCSPTSTNCQQFSRSRLSCFMGSALKALWNTSGLAPPGQDPSAWINTKIINWARNNVSQILKRTKKKNTPNWTTEVKSMQTAKDNVVLCLYKWAGPHALS